jgi:hypothetical protein
VPDFPLDRIPDGVQVLSAADFALNTVDLDPAAVLRALEEMSARFMAPPTSPEEIVNKLEQRYSMGEAADIIRSYLH